MALDIQPSWQDVLSDLSSSKYRILLDKNIDNKEKVKACYLNKCIYSNLSNWLRVCSQHVKYEKDNQEAVKYRTKGNEFYKKGNILQSLFYYTKAVFIAPKDSEELKLAFGNRSAALFQYKKYEECLSDINHAITIDNKTPTARDVRLMYRKAKALEILERYTEAINTYNFTKKTILDCSQNDKKTLGSLEHELDKHLGKLKINSDCVGISEEDKFKFLTNDFVSKPDFPGASSKLSLKESNIKGRHVISNEDISIGEVLFVEKPFAFVVLPDFLYERCQTCCKFIVNSIPCKHCTKVGFCNEECRRLAWNKFHKWECGFGINLNYMIGIAHLGFRLAIVGHNNPTSFDYERVKNLQHHILSLESDDLYQYTLTATLLMIYLEKYTNFLEGTNRLESLFGIGGAILLHITQMVCNGHAITDIVLADNYTDEQIIYEEEQARIATAIYPSASMMNHSCDPTIINGFKDQYLIVRSVKEIKKGEEVYNCYGPNFRRVTRTRRRIILMQQYKFLCKCEQCDSKEDFINRFIGYCCSNKKCDGTVPIDEIHCAKCQMLVSEECIKTVEKAKDIMQRAKCAATNKDFQKSVNLAEEAFKLFTKYLYKFHKEILECKDFLSRNLVSMGRYYDSYKLVEGNLMGNKERYGNSSIEVANEIVKLSDIAEVILNNYYGDATAMKIKDTKIKEIQENIYEYMKEGMHIIKLHYGKRNQKHKVLSHRLFMFQAISQAC